LDDNISAVEEFIYTNNKIQREAGTIKALKLVRVHTSYDEDNDYLAKKYEYLVYGANKTVLINLLTNDRDINDIILSSVQVIKKR
jgi:hypothetical protein